MASAPAQFLRRSPRAKRPARGRGRARRWLGFGGFVVLGGLALAYHLVTEPGRLRRICESRLRWMVDGDVRIEYARFGLFDGLELGGVSIAGPRTEGATSSPPDMLHPDLYCRMLLVKHDPIQLLLGRWVVEEIAASEPICHVVRDESDESYNLGRLFQFRATRKARTGGPLPVVRVRDATLILARKSESGAREVERVALSAVAAPAADDPSAYMLTWKTGGQDGAEGRSRVTLDPLTITDLEGGLPWLSLETAMLGADVQMAAAGHWFGLLGLSGRIRAEDYAVSMSGGSEPARVTIRLRDAALAVPIDEVEESLPPDQRYLRFEHVEGQIELCGDTVEADFSAQFHEADCHVSAMLGGHVGAEANLGDVAFQVAVDCRGLQLPSDDPAVSAVEARFVTRWRPMRSFFNDFNPSGEVSIQIVASKAAGADQSARLERGLIEVVNAEAAYRMFPYVVSRLRGRVELDSKGIHIRELNGDHDGAPIAVRGWVQEAHWWTAAELHFGGRGVQLDDALHDALAPRYRKIWDQFHLTGRAKEVDVTMVRPAGQPERSAPWRTTVRAELADAQARFTGFPYPLEGLQGSLLITPSRIEVGGLTGRNGEAVVSVAGYAELGESGPSDMNLQLRADGVTFDNDLMAALPDASRAMVSAFAPKGAFDLGGGISFDPASRQVTYDLTAAVRDVQVTYEELPATVEQVSGDIRIEPGHVRIEQLSGRRGPARIAMSGAFAATGGEVDATAVVRCEDLSLDEGLLAALPAAAAAICRGLNVSGSLDTTTYYERSGPAGGETVRQRTVIEADGISMRDENFPLPLTDVRGTLTVEPGRVSIDRLNAKHGEAQLTLAGPIRYTPDAVDAELTVTAESFAFDEALRQAVPWRLRRLWNNVSPEGQFDLRLDRLHYRREYQGGTGPRSGPVADEAGNSIHGSAAQTNAASDSVRWDFAGRLSLNKAALDVGAPVREMDGTLTGSGALVGSPARLDLAGDLALDHVTIYGKPLKGVRGRVEGSGREESMVLRELNADMCGGRATGEVQLFYGDDDSRYDVAATLADVDLAQFLNAGRPPDDRIEDVSGRMDAHLFMGSAGGDPRERRGGGRVLVREGQLYRLPLVTAIQGEARIRPPDESALQELTGAFFIAGPQVELQDIVLQGTGLALIGAGELSPSDGALDLTLVAVSPRNWVKVPVITEFLEGAARELVEINVRGTVSEPHIATRPLRGVEAALETLFQGRNAPRQR